MIILINILINILLIFVDYGLLILFVFEWQGVVNNTKVFITLNNDKWELYLILMFMMIQL